MPPTGYAIVSKCGRSIFGEVADTYWCRRIGQKHRDLLQSLMEALDELRGVERFKCWLRLCKGLQVRILFDAGNDDEEFVVHNW